MMYDANVNLADTSSMIWPSISVIFGLCYAIGLIIGGHMVLAGNLSLGALVTFVVTVADVTVLNIGAAFWGLVAGIVVSLLLERPDFTRTAA